MPLLYRVLRQLLRWALELYYVEIQRVGGRGVPESGPLIFAANHPNSIMDTVILGTQTSRQICYMARSGLFSNALSRWLFNRVGVIPIYRAQDGQEGQGTAQNTESFTRAYEVLEGGGCIGIFPEGQNALERHVRPIKTGTARIALEAEARRGWELGVRIVPVGLNFESRTRFLSGVLIRFGEPIPAARWRGAYEADPRGAVRQLTDAIQEGLREQAVHIEEHRHVELVQAMMEIYGRDLPVEQVYQDAGRPGLRRWMVRLLLTQLRSSSELRRNLRRYFATKQRLAEAVQRWEARDPARVEALRGAIRVYQDHLDQHQVREGLTRSGARLPGAREAIKMTLYAVLFAPFALWGLVNNVAPYALARGAWESAPEEAIRAIRGFGVAFVAFPFFYALQGFALYELLREEPSWPWWVSSYLGSLPPAGFFWLRYTRQLMRFRSRVIARQLFRGERVRLWMIQQERLQLLQAFEALLREDQAALSAAGDEGALDAAGAPGGELAEGGVIEAVRDLAEEVQGEGVGGGGLGGGGVDHLELGSVGEELREEAGVAVEAEGLVAPVVGVDEVPDDALDEAREGDGVEEVVLPGRGAAGGA